jgi:hypothetical protein
MARVQVGEAKQIHLLDTEHFGKLYERRECHARSRRLDV